MQIFLNELSLTGQYQNQAEFITAVREFESMFYLLSDILQEKQVFQSSLFLHRNAVKNSLFISSIEHIPDKSLKQRFIRLIYNRLNAKDWSQEQEHSEEDSFICQITNNEVVKSSLAEIAQRVENNRSITKLLINFLYSDYTDNKFVPIIKNDQTDRPIDLDCVETKKQLELWLENELKLSETEFDFSFNSTPTDRQTVLKDSDRFQPTSYLSPHGRRRVFLEIDNHRYWYVDNFHGGARSHLEVFDRNGSHIGEASLKGQIDNSKVDVKKRLPL